MELVKIASITDLEVKGFDEDGTELRVTKAHRILDLKVGDYVQGHLLNDDENPDEFYIEAVQRVFKVRVGYMVTGTIDLVVTQIDLEHVEQKIADDVSDRQLLRGIDNDGQGIDGDQIIIDSIESLPDEDGNVVTYFEAGHILNS